MKKITFSLTTAAVMCIILLNSIIAFSTPITHAATTFETQWRLSIIGLVNNPLDLTLNDLVAMPQTTVEANIYCVDFPDVVVTGGKWTGVKLSYLLEAAGSFPSAIKVAFYAADGYSTDLDIDEATRESVILAYEKDSAPLSETLRLVVPGKWGYKWISQIIRIALVDYDFLGKWESQGYSDVANFISGTVRLPTQLVPTIPSPTPSQPSEPTTPTSPPATQSSNSSSSTPSEQLQNPSLDAAVQNSASSPATWIIPAITVAAIGTCLLVYVKKRRH
jgi:hypothetical protein